MKMSKRLWFLALLCISVAASAAENHISKYTSTVFDRVVSKVNEALSAKRNFAEFSGVVTMVSSDWFFIQNENGLKIFVHGSKPQVGDMVKVSGSPSLEGGHIVLEAKNWQRIGEGELPQPILVSAGQLLHSTDADANFMRVSVKGRAIGTTDNGFALNVDGVPLSVMTRDLPDFMADCETFHPLVTVVGVAELILDQSVLLGDESYVIGVKINVASESDIKLNGDFSYFAARHRRLVMLTIIFVSITLAAGLFIFAIIIYRQRRGMFRTRTIMAERKRMADDIHDTIEQHLVGAGMLLKLNRTKEAQEVLVRAKREIRDIVWGLKNDDMMRLSPAEMLRQLAHKENTKGIYRVDTRLSGLPQTMDAAAMRDLSLIVREAIGNAVKHGGANRIAISADKLDGGWMLRVSNNGSKFNPQTAPGAAEGHFGLEGMQQRARRIGAELTFEERKTGMVLVLKKRI